MARLPTSVILSAGYTLKSHRTYVKNADALASPRGDSDLIGQTEKYGLNPATKRK